MAADKSTAVVGGEWMEQTIATHVTRCEHLLTEEQAKVSPDNALIAVLCDSVRMAREYTRIAQSASESPSAERRLEARRQKDCPMTDKPLSRSRQSWTGYGVQSIDRYIQEPGQVGICPSRLFKSKEAALAFNGGELKAFQVVVKVTVEPA